MSSARVRSGSSEGRTHGSFSSDKGNTQGIPANQGTKSLRTEGQDISPREDIERWDLICRMSKQEYIYIKFLPG